MPVTKHRSISLSQWTSGEIPPTKKKRIRNGNTKAGKYRPSIVDKLREAGLGHFLKQEMNTK